MTYERHRRTKKSREKGTEQMSDKEVNIDQELEKCRLEIKERITTEEVERLMGIVKELHSPDTPLNEIEKILYDKFTEILTD